MDVSGASEKRRRFFILSRPVLPVMIQKRIREHDLGLKFTPQCRKSADKKRAARLLATHERVKAVMQQSSPQTVC
jgi:hypothetical protein